MTRRTGWLGCHLIEDIYQSYSIPFLLTRDCTWKLCCFFVVLFPRTVCSTLFYSRVFCLKWWNDNLWNLFRNFICFEAQKKLSLFLNLLVVSLSLVMEKHFCPYFTLSNILRPLFSMRNHARKRQKNIRITCRHVCQVKLRDTSASCWALIPRKNFSAHLLSYFLCDMK